MRALVLIIEQDHHLRRALRRRLELRDFEVVESPAWSDPSSLAGPRRPNLVLVGSSSDGANQGLEVTRQVRQWNPRVPVILMTSKSSESIVLAALRAGVSDYFTKPVPEDELAASIERRLAVSGARETIAEPGACESIAGAPMIGQSLAMRGIRQYITRLAQADSTVLVTGETGTGKELVAELIHRRSERRRRPIISINCAAIPESLLESELFGHERGAFTGAYAPREGKLELADGGTAFFDEIGDMSPYGQAKILRVIETQAVDRLGSRHSVAVSIRIIAATNQDLDRLVEEGRFRRDLYFRLNVARIHLPPLKERREDIPLLLAHYVEVMNRRFGLHVEGFTDDAMQHLYQHDWPGNVRELKNLVEAVFISLPNHQIEFGDLPESFRWRLNHSEALPPDERQRLLHALLATNWNKSKAAEKLHWSRMTLYRKMAKYGVALQNVEAVTL